MARNHARILTSIWTNPDFTAMTERAQRLFILACSQPNLSYAGVIPFTSKRWAGLASDTTPKKLEAAAAELQAARFVVLDTVTDELLIRSFLKHDGVLKSPNMCRAMVKDYNAILSADIRAAIVTEIPDPYPEPLVKGFPEGFPEPFAHEITRRVRGRVSVCAPARPPTPTPTPTPEEVTSPLTDTGGAVDKLAEEPTTAPDRARAAANRWADDQLRAARLRTTIHDADAFRASKLAEVDMDRLERLAEIHPAARATDLATALSNPAHLRYFDRADA